MTSVFLKVLVVFAIASFAHAQCSGLAQAPCASTPGCRFRSTVGACVKSAESQYIWVRANEVTYSQLTLASGWTIVASSTDLNIFHGPETAIVNGAKVAATPTANVPANPSLGKLVPWDADTVHYRNQQPPLVQAPGTFAYLYTSSVANPPITTFPKLDSFEFFYKASNGDEFWGDVKITIAHPTALIDTEAYKCKDTQGGTKNGQPWNGPFSYGPQNTCFRGAASSIHRPWVTKHELPRVWEEITNANINDAVLNYGPLVDGLEATWINNALNLTANGRLGYNGQRVYGFEPFTYEDSRTNNNPWNLDIANRIPQTVSFDKQCVASVSSGSPNGWGNVFKALPETNALTSTQKQCNAFTHNYLCANAPLLTVQSGIIQKVEGGDSPHNQPWTTLLDDCQVFTSGIFKWDLILNYCKNGKYGNCANAGGNVFQVTQSGGDWLVKFTYYNTAIQPASQIDSADQKGRGWIEVRHKYDVSLTLAGRLDFAFETGIDIFTVDVQWFRYESLIVDGSTGRNDRGMGINLVVYPEGYDAGYPEGSPRYDSADQFKRYHNHVPKKVTQLRFYKNPTDVADQMGGTAASRPVGLPTPYLSDAGWDGSNQHFVVHPCRPEAVGTPSGDSCDYQNMTVRIRMPNDGLDHFVWAGRLVFQFTLVNGEHPNFIMDMNYKQTALATSGSFSGKSASCRTYPKLIEAEVQQRDPNIPHQGVSRATESHCSPLSKAECGPSARETTQGGQGLGCAWNYNRQACLPQYSVTCQEVDSKVFGPTDRAIIVYDITDVDASCTSVYKLWFEWTSGGVSNKIYAIFPTDETLPTESGKTVARLFPNYEFLMFQPLSELERNLYPLPQVNLWDYGFVFEPGTINDNVQLKITAQLRISATCATKRMNKRFKQQESSDSEMAFDEKFSLAKTSMSQQITSSAKQGNTPNANTGVVPNVMVKPADSKATDNSPIYITLGAIFGCVCIGAVVAVVVIRRRQQLPASEKRIPSTADASNA